MVLSAPRDFCQTQKLQRCEDPTSEGINSMSVVFGSRLFFTRTIPSNLTIASNLKEQHLNPVHQKGANRSSPASSSLRIAYLGHEPQSNPVKLKLLKGIFQGSGKPLKSDIIDTLRFLL
ncbi:unnamed protein product [Allacma fusca]|uniref:Uncharacterized protein n=1 Tax=Allacma fusca TaxID=39272 RepID=A0A8J2K680_9HEXA|nr:unnamed protein product [Allacma fusca]